MSDAPEENPTMRTAKLMGIGGIIAITLLGLAVFVRQGAAPEPEAEPAPMTVDSVAADTVH